jgi:hypothetical protein
MLPIAQSQNTQQLAQAASAQLLRNFSEMVPAACSAEALQAQ